MPLTGTKTPTAASLVSNNGNPQLLPRMKELHLKGDFLMTQQCVTLTVDGSCRGNPGPGGYAAILQYRKHDQARAHERELVGGVAHTTNNRMELTAVLTGLQALKRPCHVQLITDSRYVQGILRGTKAKANRDLVQAVRKAATPHTLDIEHVAGHSGHPLNERCHQLAFAQATEQLQAIGA